VSGRLVSRRKTLARRADDDDNDELFQELEDQAREMADMVEARLAAEGL